MFVNQLAELLFKLNYFGKIELIGYSMGGAIALSFAEIYPERIHSLTLVAPAGMPPLKRMFPPRIISSLLFQLPLFVQDFVSFIIASKGLILIFQTKVCNCVSLFLY